MRADMLTPILSDLNGSSADIEGTAIVSADGLMMAALLPSSVDEGRVGAMSAALLSLGDRAAKELARSSLEQVLIKGDKGSILMTYAGKDALLVVLVKPQAKLGLILLDVKRAAEAVSTVIREILS